MSVFQPKPETRYPKRAARRARGAKCNFAVPFGLGAAPIQNPKSKIQNGLRAFTLVEMLVSLAVLVLALSVVSVVFTTTTRTAGQAAAYSETLNRVRQYMLQIEEDLKYCVPSQSIMLAGGGVIPAGLTQANLEAGKFCRVEVGNPAAIPSGFDKDFTASPAAPGYLDPATYQYSDLRADRLSFISNRPSVSQAPATSSTLNPNDPVQAFQLAAQGGVKLSPVFVTYAHGAVGRAVWNGTTYLFPQDAALQHIEQMKTSGGSSLSVIPATRWPLARKAIILRPPVPGSGDVGKTLLTAAEGARTARCEADVSDAGDTAVLDVPAFLSMFNPLALKSPYSYATWPVGIRTDIDSLLYSSGNPALHHVATVLEEVPLELRGNLGVQMLPGCVWFQVEFLMPEDPRNSVAYSDPTPNTPNDYAQRSDMPRWTSVEPGQTYVFVPDTPENRALVAGEVDMVSGAPVTNSRLESFAKLDPTKADNADAVGNRVIRLWPYAIRVTVRVYDRQGRLPEPIVRSVVHRFE